MHYQRVNKYGDPGVVKLRAKPRQDVVTYETAHERIRRDRGSASGHACVTCGGIAAEWAYDNCDPNELVSARTGCSYSLDYAHYEPKCLSCHKRFDNAHRERGRLCSMPRS